MQTPLQIEGTWEQIATLGQSLAHCRLRLTVLSFNGDEGVMLEPQIPLSEQLARIMAESEDANGSNAPNEPRQGVGDVSLPKLTAEDWERIEREFREAEPHPLLSQQFAQVIAENPEAWADLPEDLAEQHDHYIYGREKR